MKRVLFSVMAILLAIGVVGGGAFALFSDVEEIGQNVITAGTLNLQVGDNDPCTEQITISDIQPFGWDKTLVWDITNTGSLPGILSVTISPITNKEHGRNEPEIAAGDVYGDGGELGEYLKVRLEMIAGGNMWFPSAAWITLNDLGGATYPVSGYVEGGEGHDVLEPGETQRFCFQYQLKDAADINIIQSDSVEFDITLHLDQVTP